MRFGDGGTCTVLRDLIWLKQATGLELYPWQRRMMIASALGIPLQFVGARRNGRQTVRRLLDIAAYAGRP